jgi:glycosyltransferase involved in cell wall biosynthesis
MPRPSVEASWDRNDMPRVLLLCEYATLNGGERSMLATLEGIAAAGFEPLVAAPPRGPLAEVLRQRGVEHLPWQVWDAAGVRLPQGQLREGLAELVARARPGLLHANSLSMGRLSGPVAAVLGLPSIAHLRDIIRLSARATRDLQEHKRLLAVSQAVRDYYVRNVARSLRGRGSGSLGGAVCGSRSDPPTLGAGIAPGKVHVLYNGVDLEEFCPRPGTGYLHRELGIPDGAPLACTIGQIGLRKGQDVLARAAIMLADKLPELHWLIVGDRHSEKGESRQFEAELHRAAEGLAGRLHFLGYRNDAPQLLRELTILVHPARQEPLGRVLLEAAASGVATVATDVGGTREVFPPDADAAVLVPPDDPQAIAGAVRRLVEDPVQRVRIATAARRRAEEAFDIRQSVAGLVGHYGEVLQR